MSGLIFQTEKNTYYVGQKQTELPFRGNDSVVTLNALFTFSNKGKTHTRRPKGLS